MTNKIHNNHLDLSSYISKVDNQDIKVLLLKIKNETKKPDVSWEMIKNLLVSLSEKDKEILIDVFPLLLKEE